MENPSNRLLDTEDVHISHLYYHCMSQLTYTNYINTVQVKGRNVSNSV